MSYTLLSETRPKARRQYPCIWCREKIEAGQVHVKTVGTYCGEMQSNRFHPECLTAMHDELRMNDAEEFEEHAHERGSMNEARSTNHLTP